jgi:hypothetical protein
MTAAEELARKLEKHVVRTGSASVSYGEMLLDIAHYVLRNYTPKEKRAHKKVRRRATQSRSS